MLNVALSGLRAFQTALDTTSHNIANSGTPGYSRQRVDLATQRPGGTAGLIIGSGVAISGVNRTTDALLALQMRRASSTFSSLDAYTSKAGELNNLFANSQTGLTASLQKFSNALQGVASTPSSVSTRQVLLAEANGLVTRLQAYESRLDDLDAQINDQLRAEVASINSIARNIAELNQQIARASGGGGSPNDLLDARDRQLADLAARVEISAVKQDDGSLNVFIGTGQPLVLGANVSEIVTRQDDFQPQRLSLAIRSPAGTIDISSSLTGGAIGGLMDFRRDLLDPARNELGRIAVALADATNQQHRSGQDLYGDLGGDFFGVGPVQVLRSSANGGSAVLTATRTDVGALTADDYLMRYDGSSWTVQRASTGEPVAYTLNAGALQFDGISVAVSGAANAGDQFMVRPTGGAIDGLAVRITDPSRVAAAAPIRSAAGTGNTGTATISSGEVLDAANPALRSGVTIQFTGPGTWEALDSTNTVIASGAYVPGGDIDVNGWRVQIDGAAATGDTFTVTSNVGGVGDNRNALQLAAVLSEGVLGNGTESLDAAASRIVGSIGVTTNGANASLEAHRIIYDDSVAALDGVAGVNLDEEAANLLRYQQAYQAVAQTIRVAQTIFDTIIASVGR